MENSLRNRLTLGPILLAGLLLVLWLDHHVENWTAGSVSGLAHDKGIRGAGLAVLMLLVVPLAIRELATLFAAKKVQPYSLLSVAGSALLIVHAFCTQFVWFQKIGASSLAFIICGVMLLAALQRAMGKKSDDAIVHMAGTVLAVLYLGGLAWFLIALRVKHGAVFSGTTWHVVMILLAVKFTDIGAFFTGKAIGRHKLIPWLSPGKTWEGLIGGLITAGAISAAVAPMIPNMTWYKGALFGVLIGGVGQLGDLLESMFKRDAAVKDSGNLLPGFGGVLDVIDSPLLAAPFAYVLFSLMT
jgi:phosphatidate cytidylyltransferase